MINASRVRLGRMEDLKLIMTDKIALAPVRTLSKARDPSACRSSATKLGGDPLWKWDKLADNVLLGFSLFNAAAALVHHYIWYDAVLKLMLPGTIEATLLPGHAHRSIRP